MGTKPKGQETPILMMDGWRAHNWCQRHWLDLNDLWLREMVFCDQRGKMAARHLEGLAGFRGAYSIIHEQRATVLQEEKDITGALRDLVRKLELSLRGEEQNPFPNELSPDEARVWLAETRSKLLAKMRHEKSYLKMCQNRHTQPHKDAATEKDLGLEQDVLGLLNELLATFPPLKLSKPKSSKGQKAAL